MVAYGTNNSVRLARNNEKGFLIKRKRTNLKQAKLNRIKVAKLLHSRGWNGVSTDKFDTHRSVSAEGGH